MIKKILLLLIAYQFPFFTSIAQKLVVEKPTLECGRTGFQQPVTAIFDLKNKSRKKLMIESVKPDCGCTAVEYPKEVGAGDKFTIKMTYDARQLGHFQKSAAVISNASKQPVYLTMRGVVLTEVQDYTGSYPLTMGALLLDQDVLEFDAFVSFSTFASSLKKGDSVRTCTLTMSSRSASAVMDTEPCVIEFHVWLGSMLPKILATLLSMSSCVVLAT
jgi:hypothetical protein